MSGTLARMVHSFAEDPTISNADIRDALLELDGELAEGIANSAPISLERYRLRKVLRAVAGARGLDIASAG